MNTVLVLIVVAAVVLIPLLVVGAWLMVTYNRLIRLRNGVSESWAQIHTQEQQRMDQISQLVDAVKGYASHEKGIFDQYAEARGAFSRALNEGSAEKMADAHKAMDQSMVNIKAVSEAYPELKASNNFMQLQDEISSLERKIAAARRYYNGNVREHNQARQVFPTSIVAGMLGFREDKEYFSLDEEAARQAPKIDFS